MAAPRFVLAGGDERSLWLARLMQADGISVSLIGLGAPEDLPPPRAPEAVIPRAEAVILGVPAVKGAALYAPLAEEPLLPAGILRYMPPGAVLCGGMLTDALRVAAELRGIDTLDYYADPVLALRNTVPTAEGAIALAMANSPRTLDGSPALVLGAGRVGKALALRLAGLGACVTVTARKREDLALLELMGLTAVPTEAADPAPYRFIFNTVPAPVLGAEKLVRVRPDALLMELASAPGGIDREACTALGLTLICAPGLPGKVAPCTAAEYIRDALRSALPFYPKGS